AVPGDRQHLQPTIGKLDQILLERIDAEGVFDLENAERAIRPVGLNEEFSVLAEEARAHIVIVETRVGKIAKNSFVVGMGHRVAMLRAAPETCFRLVAASAGLAADKTRRACYVTAAVRLCSRQLPEDAVGQTHEDDGRGRARCGGPYRQCRPTPDALLVLRQVIRGRQWFPAGVLASGSAANGRLGPVVRQRSNSSYRVIACLRWAGPQAYSRMWSSCSGNIFQPRARATPQRAHGPFASGRSLLTRPVLHRLLNLLLHCFKVERSRSLHRRKLDRGLRQVADVLLDHDEAPELPGEEVVAVPERPRVRRLAPSTRL